MRLIYSEQAVRDLVRLRAFIAEKNPPAARRVSADLLARIGRLRDVPRLGREVSRAPDPSAMRDAVFGNYVLRNVPRPDVLIVLRIWHHDEDRSGRD
jgi:plasmid stabilization system protein ParE